MCRKDHVQEGCERVLVRSALSGAALSAWFAFEGSNAALASDSTCPLIFID